MVSCPGRLSAAMLSLVFCACVSSAHERFYIATLSGANASPPNGSHGTGFALVTLDLDLVTMRIEMTFENLQGTVTSSNLFGPTALPLQGVAGDMTPAPGFINFPLGVSSGSYDYTYDLTVAAAYDPQFLAASGTVSDALNRLIGTLRDSRAYISIQTTAFPGGEIRSFCIAPCPADFNHDNIADFFDYLDFVDSFSGGFENSDFNQDETIDFFDYLDFVEAFSAGC